jgi:hypothetical protein
MSAAEGVFTQSSRKYDWAVTWLLPTPFPLDFMISPAEPLAALPLTVPDADSPLHAADAESAKTSCGVSSGIRFDLKQAPFEAFAETTPPITATAGSARRECEDKTG